MKPALGVLSLGCPRNLVDSEGLLGRLKAKGYSIVDLAKAEVAIINTCAFIDSAKEESIDAILDLIELKKAGRLKKIIVYGCLPQRYKDSLTKELPEIDAFVGRVALSQSRERFPITPRHYAYLKICEGCLNKCSFCVIPGIKGKFVSLGLETILKEVEGFNRSRISELNIIGQDITGFGADLNRKENLSSLLKKIIKKAVDIRWIRLLYLNPSRINDDLLEVIKGQAQVCKYIDLPIQHINSRILKLMCRKTTGKDIIKTIQRIRKVIPGVALRTSIIVGFPGESEEEFKELLDFIKEVKFERLGAFTYSAQEGTPAFSFKGQVPEKIKVERLDRVMLEQQKVSIEINQKFLGKTLEVLLDEEDNGVYLGRTEYDAPEVDGTVQVKSGSALRLGDFVKVKITDTLEYDLVGEVEE